MPWWSYCVLGFITVIVYDVFKRILNKHINNNLILSLVCLTLTVVICTGLFIAVDRLLTYIR